MRATGSDERDRDARHPGGRGERGGAGLEVAELAVVLGAGALGEDEQRHALLQEHLRADAPRVDSRPVDGERVEEEAGEAAAPPDVEEVVRGCAGGEVARHPPRQRSHDERGVEVTRVVGDRDERLADVLELLAAVHLDVDRRPGDGLQDAALRDEARGGTCS
jgi:hypothetical protein